jgi:hypothetical protein
VQPVIAPLGLDPRSQLGVFAVAFRNIAVPVEFAIVGKFTQTAFPVAEVDPPIESYYAFQFLDTGGVKVDVFPSRCHLYCILWFATQLASLELSL